MVRDQGRRGWRALKIVEDDEDELKSDDLYSDEDIHWVLWVILAVIRWGDVWKNNMGII